MNDRLKEVIAGLADENEKLRREIDELREEKGRLEALLRSAYGVIDAARMCDSTWFRSAPLRWRLLREALRRWDG